MPRKNAGVVGRFDAAIKELNAELWLLMALVEGLASLSSKFGSQMGTRYPDVLQALLPHATRRSRCRVRLRDKSAVEDLRALAESALGWLPEYFLLLARAIAEGFVQDRLLELVKSDARIKEWVEVRRQRPAPQPRRRRTEVIEQASSELCRGAFMSIPLELTPGLLDAKKRTGIARRLKKLNRRRNALAHDLANVKAAGPRLRDESIRRAIRDYQDLIDALL